MIAKLEWTKSNAQQNLEQLQNPTMGATINKDSNTPRLYSQWLNSVIYWLIYH